MCEMQFKRNKTNPIEVNRLPGIVFYFKGRTEVRCFIFVMQVGVSVQPTEAWKRK